MGEEKKNVIPFKYYSRFILISVLLAITIGIVIFTNFTKENKYDFPFVTIVDQNQEIVRVYPASNFEHIVIDDNPLTYHAAKSFINKTMSYEKISDYNFGQIDHYVKSGIYKIYDIYGVNYLTLYEQDKKIVGLTYKYMQNKTGTTEFPEREYIYQDVARIEKMIGNKFTVEPYTGFKNFVVNRKKMIYTLSAIANDTTADTIGGILSMNKDMSINLSVFNTMASYNNFKMKIQN
jgi:hypothetical protein